MELTNNKLNNYNLFRKPCDNSNLLKTLKITEREVYEFYRKNRKAPSKTIDQYNYFVKAVDGILGIISDMIADSEGGVYIEDFGYFCCLKIMKRRKRKLLKPRQVYKPIFVPDTDFKQWTMSYMEDVWLTRRVRQSGVKYKLYFNVCLAHRISEQYSLKLFRHKYRHKRTFKFQPKI